MLVPSFQLSLSEPIREQRATVGELFEGQSCFACATTGGQVRRRSAPARGPRAPPPAPSHPFHYMCVLRPRESGGDRAHVRHAAQGFEFAPPAPCPRCLVTPLPGARPPADPRAQPARDGRVGRRVDPVHPREPGHHVPRLGAPRHGEGPSRHRHRVQRPGLRLRAQPGPLLLRPPGRGQR